MLDSSSFSCIVYGLHIPPLTATARNVLAVAALVGIVKTFLPPHSDVGRNPASSLEGNSELLGVNRETRAIMLSSLRGRTNGPLGGPSPYDHTHSFTPTLYLYFGRPEHSGGWLTQFNPDHGHTFARSPGREWNRTGPDPDSHLLDGNGWRMVRPPCYSRSMARSLKSTSGVSIFTCRVTGIEENIPADTVP